MTEEQIALARRAVACKGWRWMPGTRWVNDPAQPVTSDGDEGRHEYGYPPPKYGVPVLEDPATLGCLIALVREAWGDPAYLWGGHAEVRRDSETLFVVLRFGHDANGFLVERWVSSGTTEAEALVAALEAAP